MTQESRREVLLKWLVFFGALTFLIVGAVLYEYLIEAPKMQSL
jgi:hypothetical protein